MGYWTKAEVELLINLEGKEPGKAQAYTNWPRFINRLNSSEGFDQLSTWSADDGSREMRGNISLAPYRYLYLRANLAAGGQDEWNRQQALLPKLKSYQSEFRLGTGERETCLLANMADPYWLHISTDMSWWLRRLQDNQWAVLIEEAHYAGTDDGGIDCMSTYVVPLSLLQIRRARPQLTDAEKAERTERLKS